MENNRSSYNKEIINHYDTQDGVGNAYVLVADWPVAIKGALLGWENVLEHPAAVHYARDYAGKGLNPALKLTGFEAFERLGLPSGTILDCGCGVGGTTLSLSKKYPNCNFVGVSLSPGQINTAKKRAEKSGCKNIRYLVANYLSLPFEDSSFDGILGVETFCHVVDEDKDRLFSELNRVLKVGGKVSVSDAFLNSRPLDQMVMPELHARIFRGWTLPDKISTLEYFILKAQEHGFKVVSKMDVTDRILGCSQEAAKRASSRRILEPIAKLLIKLRAYGIRLPVVSRLGFDNKAILEFAYTAEMQFKMFESRDTQYWDVLLKKV